MSVPLRPSRLLWLGIALAHLLPLCVLLAPEVPGSAAAATAALVLLSGLLTWPRLHLSLGARLVCSPEGTSLEMGEGARAVDQLRWTALGPLRALDIRFADSTRLSWVVMRDGFSAEDWRRLNVYLRWRVGTTDQD